MKKTFFVISFVFLSFFLSLSNADDKRVCIFSSGNPLKLSKQCNDFLKNNNNIVVVDIKYFVSENDFSFFIHHALIIYKER